MSKWWWIALGCLFVALIVEVLVTFVWYKSIPLCLIFCGYVWLFNKVIKEQDKFDEEHQYDPHCESCTCFKDKV